MRQQPILSTILPFLFILLFSLYWAASKDDTQTFVQCLKKKSENSTSITQIIYTRSNPSYTEILNRFIENLLFGTPDTPKPVAVLTPFHESHIQTAIYCSKKLGLEMRIRSGGNDIEGSSYVSNVPFLVLDMYGFRSISVNAKEKTVWSGAGATYGELYYAINQTDASLAFPGPYWPTVGVGGHICSGGFGGLIRKYGVGADNVVDARIINAKGEILDRKSMGKDLFWAIRGGSCASFGVVVAFKLKLVRIPKVIAVFNVKRTLEQDGAFLINKWQYIAPNLPRELMVSLQLTNVVLQNSTKQTVIANFIASFLGDIESLSSIMNRDFPELGLIQSDYTTVVGWAESTIYHLGVPLEQSVPTLLSRIPPEPIPYLKMQSDFFQSPIPKKGLEGMLDLLMQAPAGESFMEMSPLKGILDDIPESSIPFPHRKGNLFLIGERIAWFESGRVNAEKRLAWSRKFHKFLGKYVPNNPRSAFVNYRDYGLGVNHHINNANGDPTSVEQAKRSWGAPYFKDNFDRLVQVKTRVDPENFFNYEQSFPVLPLNSFKVGYARS